MADGHSKEARSLLVDRKRKTGRYVTRWDLASVYAKSGHFGPLARRFREIGRLPDGRTDQLSRLRELVHSVEIKHYQTDWSDYCDEEVDMSSFDAWMTKRKVVHDVLDRIRPATVLDIGSNSGWFSKLAAMKGSRVVAFDVDEPSINKLYLNEEARRLEVLPLAMNFRTPTGAYGRGLHCAPATERFRCELVLGLAIVHHLVFKQNEKFETIVDNLAQYAQKWLLVEFIPREDKYVSKYFTSAYEWYTTHNFVEALQRRFAKVEVLPSNPDPRILLLCEVSESTP